MATVNYAPDRIYAQYRNMPKAKAWYGIVPTLGLEICTAFEQVRKSYDIDTAVGQQLDVIGRIVVIGRSFETPTNDEIYQWGQLTVQWGGAGIQYQPSGGQISNEASDVIFRTLIKSKIAKNNSSSTLDDVVGALLYITGVTSVRVIDNEDMTFSVSFGSELDATTRFVLDTFDIVPRPQGVEFLGYTEEPAITQWGGDLSWGDSRAQYGQFFGV